MNGARQSPHRMDWRSDLDPDGIEHRFDAVDQPEDLLFELRAAIAVHRSRVLPHLAAEHELVSPAPARTADQDRDAMVAAYTRILDEELAALVERMDVVQADLLQRPSSSLNRLHAVTLLAAAAALATVAARFSGEVVAPLVTETPTPQQSERVTDA